MLETELRGTMRLDKLLLVSSRGIIRSIELDGVSSALRETVQLSPEDKFLYLKCKQADNAIAWSSPVWIGA